MLLHFSQKKNLYIFSDCAKSLIIVHKSNICQKYDFAMEQCFFINFAHFSYNLNDDLTKYLRGGINTS